AKRSKKVFEDFDEGIIRFKPTYRILVGSGSFDTQRIPSWCDRIFYRSSKKKDIPPLIIKQYHSCRRITLSDHFPVSARFTLGISSSSGIFNKTDLAIWPCNFEHIPRWEQLIPLFCRLKIPSQFWTLNSSNLDWVGVYSTSIEIINRPINLVYLLTCPLDEQGRFIIEFPSLNCGMYIVGYFCSKKKCLQGLSNPFYVKEEPKY
ncbi:IPPc domain-containing protein, partial [Meloidogyne graminicola]